MIGTSNNQGCEIIDISSEFVEDWTTNDKPFLYYPSPYNIFVVLLNGRICIFREKKKILELEKFGSYRMIYKQSSNSFLALRARENYEVLEEIKYIPNEIFQFDEKLKFSSYSVMDMGYEGKEYMDKYGNIDYYGHELKTMRLLILLTGERKIPSKFCFVKVVKLNVEEIWFSAKYSLYKINPRWHFYDVYGDYKSFLIQANIEEGTVIKAEFSPTCNLMLSKKVDDQYFAYGNDFVELMCMRTGSLLLTFCFNASVLNIESFINADGVEILIVGVDKDLYFLDSSPYDGFMNILMFNCNTGEIVSRLRSSNPSSFLVLKKDYFFCNKDE